jgi:hypothetical protein
MFASSSNLYFLVNPFFLVGSFFFIFGLGLSPGANT